SRDRSRRKPFAARPPLLLRILQREPHTFVTWKRCAHPAVRRENGKGDRVSPSGRAAPPVYAPRVVGKADICGRIARSAKADVCQPRPPTPRRRAHLILACRWGRRSTFLRIGRRSREGQAAAPKSSRGSKPHQETYSSSGGSAWNGDGVSGEDTS